MALLLADALFAALHPPCVDGAAPPRVCIVATSQAMDALPAPLLRPWLWSTCHTLEAPDQMAREALLATLLRDAAQDPARCEAQQAPADFSQLAARTEGFVAVDFAALVASAAHLMDTSADSAASGVAREHKCWVEALDGALLAHSPLHLSALGATKVEVTLRHVGGMTEAKAQLTEVLAWPLLYPALMQGLPVKRPAGVLLYGPSGCGKTLLAQVRRRRLFSSPGCLAPPAFGSLVAKLFLLPHRPIPLFIFFYRPSLESISCGLSVSRGPNFSTSTLVQASRPFATSLRGRRLQHPASSFSTNWRPSPRPAGRAARG